MHILDHFACCPACGSKNFMGNDFKSKRCADCGFTYYLNASAAVVAVVLDVSHRLLVARRRFEPARGTLDLPGGFVDAGESLEEAVRRELKEETGLTLSPERWLFSVPNRYLFSGMEIPTTDSFFLFRVPLDVDVVPRDDVASLVWMPVSSIDVEAFGLDSIRQGVRRLKGMNLWSFICKA